MENKEEFYQKMTKVFQEKEEIFSQREGELKKYREQLQKIETDISNQRKVLEQEKKLLAEEQEKITSERAELERKKEELEQSMKRMLEEKLELEAMKNELLRQDKEGVLLGMTASEPVEDNKMPEEAPTMDQPITEPVEPEPEKHAEKPEAELGFMQQFVLKAKESLPEGKILEAEEEMLCMSIGDKELRILKQNPPVAVILARREKSKDLMKGISQFNKMQDEWEFSYNNSCLQCMMPFTETTTAEVVLQKCADAMKRFFL